MTLCLSVTSCGLYKPYSRDVETSLPADIETSTPIRWQDVFSDPQLQALIEKALTRNTDLAAAQLRLQEAEATLKTARLGLLPSVNASANATTADFTSVSSSLEGLASWQLDIFAAKTNATRKARAAWQESEDYVHAVHTQLIARVAELYYTLALLREQRAVTAESSALWEQTIEKTRAMKEAGMVTDAALAQYEATYWSTVASLADYDKNLRMTENSLRSLLLLSPLSADGEETIIPSATFGTTEAEAPVDVARALHGTTMTLLLSDDQYGVQLAQLAARPDVRMAEEQLMQAYYDVAIARASLYPSVTLTGNARTLSFESIATQVAGALSMPLFNAGSNRAKVTIAKAKREEARGHFEQTLCDAALEVDDVVNKLGTAQAKSESLAAQVTSLERAVESTGYLMEYGTSNTTYLDVLTARRSLLSAQLSQLSNRYDELASLIALYQALGGE